MGSSSSKFHKHLQKGDEYAALQLWTSSSDLHKALDPNSSYGENYNLDTPMHYAARHAMKPLLRIFLTELGGNPNKKNCRNETVVHSVCLADRPLMYGQQQRRYECLQLLLSWTGSVLQDGRVEKSALGSKDEKENTALHYAAASGLQRCVELLVAHGAPLFIENLVKETPCDSAEKSGHGEIALYLESKMVFSHEDQNTDDNDVQMNVDLDEGYSGLRAQDLQEAKDQLLVETSDMLHVPLFTAEALLRNHEWSRELLLEAWIQDAVSCCEKCGVIPPISLYSDRFGADTDGPSTSGASSSSHELITKTTAAPRPTPDTECDICTCLIPATEERVLVSCDHSFCRSCWEKYLTGKILEGEAHNITCPGFQCSMLVPVEVIETLVSRDMARRYLQFDIKAFVESNPYIKWCPYPGCGRAVRLPETDNPMSPTFRLAGAMHSPSDTSRAVDCGNGHSFCWECAGEAHEPASCENWKNWHQKIAEVKPEELSGTDEETENTANCLWLVTNSKPCSNCKSPIQKNEGCNHMKCSKCKHDFCWVCLEPWKKHSTATGGYFRCNRYEVVKKVEETQEQEVHKAESKNKKMQELNRFVHYYSRFKNHENSYKLEVPLFDTAKAKMMVLAKAVTDHDSANQETKFVQDAVTQLLKARHVLKCSYVYGYYLEETGYKKPIYEFMQTELEECTETLSEMVARPYLRTPRSKIVQTAHLVQRKRHELVTAIAKGLVPPDTSPNSRKKRKMFSVEVDEDTRKALIASMQDDPSNPWVKDPSGKHTNVSALLDWPEESDESDSEAVSPSKFSALAAAAAATAGTSTDAGDDLTNISLTLAASQAKVCQRVGCQHSRARNPRTGELHNYCSMKCMRLDIIERDHNENYQMDTLRALEMSRLQFLHEMGSLRPGTGERSPRSPSLSPHLSPATFHETSRHRSITGAPDVEFPGLILSKPPGGRNQITASQRLQMLNPGGAVDAPFTSSELFDPDLEKALAISSLSLQDEERQLSLAIELSMKDSSSTNIFAPPPVGPPMVNTSSNHTTNFPLRSSSSSPINTDIGRGDSSTSCLLGSSKRSRKLHGSCGEDPLRANQPPECTITITSMPKNCVALLSSSSPSSVAGRPYTDGQQRRNIMHDIDSESAAKFDSTKRKSAFAAAELSDSSLRCCGPQSDGHNAFGIIKDISVANILPSDNDKTKDFAGKDFSRLFAKHFIPGGGIGSSCSASGVDACGDGCGEMFAAMDAEIENVFEPRPPHPDFSSSPPSAALPGSGVKCAFTENETVSMVDPWRQHMNLEDDNSGCSSTQVKFFRPHCRSWKEGVKGLSRPAGATRLGMEFSTEAASADLTQSSDQPMRRRASQPAFSGGPPCSHEHQLVESLDPANIVISSQVLESLLQGAEGYGETSTDWSTRSENDDVQRTPSVCCPSDNSSVIATSVLAAALETDTQAMAPNREEMLAIDGGGTVGTAEEGEANRDAVFV